MSDDYHDHDPSPERVIPSGFFKLDEIQGETQTRWLWTDKVPLGHVTILAGEASSGKSLLAAEIVARVSRGAGWPRSGTESLPCSDNAAPPGMEIPAGSVLIAHANKHENLVLKGRLLAAGADASRVAVMNRDGFDSDREIGEDEKYYDEPTLEEASLFTLEGALVQVPDASLVVIDHLLAWLGRSRLRPEELTEVFRRLADMAARYRVALVVLWRLEKGGRAAQTRALDALSGVAPVVWFLANDAYSSHARAAVCAQNRLGAQSEGLAFRVAGDRLVWQKAVRQVSADELVAARTADRCERRQAGEWLLDLLSQGPIEAQELWHEARACGLAERTLRRAAAELGLRPTKDGKRNLWLWGVRVENEAVRTTVGAVMAGLEELQDKETGGQRDKDKGCEAPVGTTAQHVAALPEAGSLAAVARTETGAERSQNVAVLPLVGSLEDSAVVQVELRSDTAPSVAALPSVGSLAHTGGTNRRVGQDRLGERRPTALGPGGPALASSLGPPYKSGSLVTTHGTADEVAAATTPDGNDRFRVSEVTKQ